ncbi:MAG TPA: RodZ domain-containing protein [Ramlibacter sp.]|nr:RodZ domain-containing protein [Ramlibacter sp.]
MNEAVVEHDPAMAEGPSAGALLRQARESAGVHLAALAISLKVPPRQLEALEADRLELLPDNVFARALAATVCRNLKIDPQLVLSRLPQAAPALQSRFREPINEPFRVPGEGRGAPWRQWLRKPPVLVALALLVGAFVLIVAPALKPQEPASPATTDAVTPAIVPSVPDTSVAPAPGAGLSSDAVAPVASVQPGAVDATVAAPPATPQTATAVPAIMQIQTRAQAWVQVSDARGAMLVRRNLEAGETVGIPSAPTPLAVTIGSAAAATVAVRGKPFELAAYTRDNVARFEVK